MTEEELRNGNRPQFRMWEEDLHLLSKDLFSFALKPQWVCFLLLPCRWTSSAHLCFCIFTFHVSGSVVSRPETQDSVSFGTPLCLQFCFSKGGISLTSKCQRLVHLFIRNILNIFLPVFCQALWIQKCIIFVSWLEKLDSHKSNKMQWTKWYTILLIEIPNIYWMLMSLRNIVFSVYCVLSCHISITNLWCCYLHYSHFIDKGTGPQLCI